MATKRLTEPVVTKVSTGGRIRIPREVMDALGIEDGQQVVFIPTPDPSGKVVWFTKLAGVVKCP